MVTTTCFPPSAARRYSSFRTPYLPSYVERKAVEHPHHEPSCNIMAERNGGVDDTSSQRKRIAVACGRCRKRKIRCSGDAGNNQPCTNCKNAAFEPCQFLRVSSTEVSQVKGNSFSYNVDISRLVQARGSSVPSALGVPVNAYHDAMGLSESHTLPSRGGPASAYGGKQYYAPAEWSSGYAEDSSVDYTLCQPSFPSVPEHHPYVAGPYRLASNAPTTKPNGVLYLDAQAAYGYANVPAAPVAAARQSPNTETGSLPYQSLGPGFSSSLSGSTERLTATRALPSSGPPSYRTDSAASDYRKSSQHSTGDSSSSSSIVDVPSNYHSYESSQLSYSGHSVAAQLNRHSDLYASSSSDGLLSGSESSLRPVSGCEASYRYSDAGFNRTSQPGPGSLTSSSSHPYPFQRHGQQHDPYTVAGDLVTSAVEASTGDHKPPAKTRV
ncbi:Uncharacterized protein TPAR_07991 [Tolypocladium paradoxum]|uniref:Zn(2)-C6 fungal-type domain-containing protein n=1 Tax=Tolypocladium paradoxum TaxID=94208 RepID=A0A2S4KNL5_9HYPO|nr:Uncharacterized protein TPAR_07991 [Tolypocladium paradoxum]